MHEISLVRNIFRTVAEEFPEAVEQVHKIYLAVGLLTNVQPTLMQSAFRAVQEAELVFTKAALEVEVLPVLMECRECEKVTEVKNYKFICPCGKPGRIIQGEELLIKKIEFTDKC
ncbi:MAG: hydrogenase expression protein [Candidatus Nephrothrix sp. EaCA]|nr:MAG: hydrogenase expression protein [Candidatus Nephrothrix sp. EaCA]